MASVKGTDASEHDRALMRGKNLALVLEGDLKRRCKPDVSISAYILNLGRFNDDQQGDKSDQREVIALVGAGSDDTDDAVTAALQKYAKNPPWTRHYTVCELYKLGADQPTLVHTKICDDQPGTDVSQR